jgi:CheY-like chemotaxis protein
MERTEDEVKSILVADDESDVRMVLRALLAGSGYAVTEAADGQEALDMMAEGKFDLLILDLMMPRLTGEEVLERLRAQGKLPGLPIIVLTAKSQPKDVQKGYEKGASFYVVKPFSNATIRELVRYLIDNLGEEERETILFTLMGECDDDADSLAGRVASV